MRLIDADNIEKELRYAELSKEKITWLDAYKHFKKMIDNASTAYDVEKVVEHIREVEICGDCLNNKNTIGVCATFCDVGKKLEIIKAGGVDE